MNLDIGEIIGIILNTYQRFLKYFIFLIIKNNPNLYQASNLTKLEIKTFFWVQ